MHPVQTLRLMALAFAGLVVVVIALIGALRFRKASKNFRRVAQACWALLAIGLGCFGYGIFVEADWLEVTHTTIETPKLAKGRRIRIAQVSDLHADGWTPTLRTLAARINDEKPDLFVFTGDTLNSTNGLPVVHAIWKEISAPLGKFAVKGNHDVWYWKDQPLFPPELITELKDAPPIVVGELAICGAKDGRWDRMDSCNALATDEQFLITASHRPDVIGDFTSKRRPDLLLAGHTHGGQVCLPFYGAVLTMSRFDKKFERGLVVEGDTRVYVSRGVGFEPHAPRVRFLARPELTVIDLVGTK